MDKKIKLNQALLLLVGVFDILTLLYGWYDILTYESASTVSFYIVLSVLFLALALYPGLLVYFAVKLRQYLTSSIKRVLFVLKVYIILSILGLGTLLIIGVDTFSLIVGVVTLLISIYLLNSIKKLHAEHNTLQTKPELNMAHKIPWQILTGVTKFVIAICILLFIFAGAVPAALNIFWGQDIAPIDDSDLLLSKVALSDEENMFTELDRITSEMIHPPAGVDFVHDFLNSDTWDAAFANEVFSQNHEALQLWSLAAQKNQYLQPDYADPADYSIDLPIINLSRWRQINRIALAQAVWWASTDRHQQAVDQAMNSIKIGDAILRSQNSLIGYLVGVAIKDQGLDAVQKIIEITNGVGINKAQLLTELELHNHTNENQSVFKGEYLIHKQLVGDLGAYLQEEEQNIDTFLGSLMAAYVDNNFYYKPNLTLSYTAGRTRQLVSNIQEPCMEPKELDKIFEDPLPRSVWGYLKLYVTENVIGKLMTNVSSSALNNVVTKTCELQLKHQQTAELVEGL